MEKAGGACRVLVAANTASAASATAKVLRSKGCKVVSCSSNSKLQNLLRNEKFDLVLAESDVAAGASKVDPIDGMALLALEKMPPVVVAMNKDNTQAVHEALQRGAADVIGLPMSKQHESLAALWQHGRQSATTRKRGSFAAVADLLTPDATMKDDLLSLDDLDLEPLDYDHYDHYGNVADAPGAMSAPLLDVSSPLLACTSSGNSSVEDNLTQADALSADEGACSVLSRDSSSGTTMGSKRTRGDMERGTPESSCAAPVKMEPAGSTAVSSDSSDMSGYDCESDDKLKSSKKVKVEWTRELHDKFVEAVETLGFDKAVPSRILERMGAHGTSLTRQNIASHLQKYRHRSRGRLTDVAISPATPAPTPQPQPQPPPQQQQQQQPQQPAPAQAVGSAAAPAASAPVVQATYLQPASQGISVSTAPVSQSVMMVPSGTSVGSRTAPVATTQVAAGQQQWVQTMQMWSPWPQGAVLYNQMGQPFLPQALPAPAFCQLPGSQTTSTHEVQRAIKDVLSQPKTKAPLGLSLDHAQFAEKLRSLSQELLKPMATTVA